MDYAISCLLEEEEELLIRVRVLEKMKVKDPLLTEDYDQAVSNLRDIQNALSTLQDIAKDEE
ncbi:hypothetical protein V7094_27825 [Priestia megaterium]|uniref:hypothetical protein n=1 Tax=Priestia megaterium TaxID=1404 RepID=UPI002FFE4FA1